MREFKSGNTTLIINSPLMDLSEDERKEWFDTEKAGGNAILKEIEKAVNDCYRKYD